MSHTQSAGEQHEARRVRNLLAAAGRHRHMHKRGREIIAAVVVVQLHRNGGEKKLPRLPNGSPNLDAPAPRAADGKPDLSGLWYVLHPSASSDFGSADYISSIGSGFRYLLARKFKLRVGIDVAKGPDTWAYYIVFGSNWVK